MVKLDKSTISSLNLGAKLTGLKSFSISINFVKTDMLDSQGISEFHP